MTPEQDVRHQYHWQQNDYVKNEKGWDVTILIPDTKEEFHDKFYYRKLKTSK